MSWSQKDAYWSRPFDCHDEMLHFIRSQGEPINREHWMFLVTTQISFPPQVEDIIDRLRNAWKTLRFRHPDIALEVHSDEKRYYPIYDDESLEKWCNEIFQVETECSFADDFFTKQRRSAPLANATLHWIPATNEFVLVSSHILWDGRGGMLMTHEFLSALENPIIPTKFDGAEAKKLVPSIDTVTGMPDKPKPEWERTADEMLQQYVESQPSIGLLPPGDPKAKKLPAGMDRREVVFTPEEAKSLREATPIMALAEMHDRDSQPEKFVAWSLFDLRRFLPPPFNGAEHAPSIRIASLPIIVKAHGSWSEISSPLNDLNRTSWDVKESDKMFVRDPLNRKATDMFKMAAAHPDVAPPPSSEPFMSSMGIFDDVVKHGYGHFSVENVAILCGTLTPAICLHIWSWKDALHISSTYNVAYYNSDIILRYLTFLKGILRKNLL
ncbi:hypothetical protein N7493_007361 [Penicillium malachiteum]|uniref:Uncharacterized protein n=1 Tax=Penicillium malachiteum TaxID=1324776 RepID=A0AAD6MUR2_9EURO|nr:hypothetical protein N7493_007361 [Penicillium malachiteum]